MTGSANFEIDQDQVTALHEQHEAALLAAGIDLRLRYPVARYIAFFDGLQQPIAYDHLPPEAVSMAEAIEAKAGEEMLETYHRLVLLGLLRSFEQRAAETRFPAFLAEHANYFLAHLLRRLEKPRRGQFHLDKDPFLKDLAAAGQKLWPCGAEFVDITSGIPRRMLLGAGKASFLKSLGRLKFQCGGFKPFFETHFDSRISRDFSAEGYRSLYLNIARLLDDRPTIKGVYSCSWWHDPAVAAISPNLDFLNTIALKGGARLYPMGSDDHVVAQATRLSVERSRKLRDGSYDPVRYMLVWARRDLLRWAADQSAGQRRAASA